MTAETDEKPKRSRFGRGLLLVLLIVIYVLSEPWLIFGLYKISPERPHRFRPAYVVFYAPNHFLCNHSETYRGMYLWYGDKLQAIFPDYFDFPAYKPPPP